MADSIVCWCHNPETSSPQDPFEMAWKAIENDEMSALKQAIQKMKESADGSSASLNTCRLIKKSGVTYSMSLLALCGFHERKEMVDLLLKEGADMNAECLCSIHTGTTVLQMMFHCFNQNEYDKLSTNMLEYFHQKGANFGGKISTRHFGPDHSDSGGVNYGILHLPLEMQRIDCAKMLVEAGVDPINGGTCIGEEFEVVQMFEEYRLNGTNEFICWVFNEYIPQHPEIKVDLNQIIKSIINMKQKDKMSCFWQFVQRAPAHAILTSHHEDTIKYLVQCGKENGLDLLAERSCTGKTALHVAAEDNDVKSVNILLQLKPDYISASNNSGMNPFMIAVEKGHLEVVNAMMEKDSGLVSLPMGSGSTMIHWALEKDHHRSAFFKGFIEKNAEALLTAKDSQRNTVAHLVAASGNTKVFEMLWSEKFANAVFSDQSNLEGKIPLQLAVEKRHVNILKTLKTCVDGEREAKQKETKPPLWLRRLKTEFGNKMIPYLLHASSCGSLSVIKYLLAIGQTPNVSHDGKTPLLCAAEAGHDEVVAYLLEFENVLTDLRGQPDVVESASASPLLIAAQNGHTKCVTLLLQNGANVLQRDSEDRNCLTIAIQNHNKATALAILAEENGMNALQRNKNPTPLHLLVEEMPDLAEYVLNKCVIAECKELHSIDAEDVVDGPSDEAINTANQPVINDFLEDQASHEQHDNHILVWMIKHNRLTLLQHPLVKDYLYEKFWLMTFPLLLLNLLFNIALLVTLNWFALVVPRPGPYSETCPENNETNTECEGQTEDDRKFLVTTTLLLCFLCFIGFSVEIAQLRHRGCKRYFKDSENYIQVFLYTLTLVFIHGFDNKCWCSTTSQWQIGAFAVFLSWLNFIFILKYMPCTAIPINMFLGICVTFLKLIHLLFVLIFAFGVPFYMVFVRTTSSSEELAAYRSPSHAIAKTLLQLAGEFDFEDTFNKGDLLYSPATYILFIIFLITMPILFSNLLIGLAVGEAEKKLEKAKLTTIKLQVESILDRKDSPYSHWLRKHHLGFVVALLAIGYSHCINFILNTFFLKVKCTPHDKIAKELMEQNDGIYRTVMAQNPGREDMKLREDMKQEMMAQRDDIAKLKEDMAKFMQQLTPIGGN